MIEEELLAVEDCPDEVFHRLSGLILLLFKIVESGLDFLRIGLPGECSKVKFIDFLIVAMGGIGRHHRSQSLICREFCLDVFRIEQMEALRQIGPLGSFAFAGGRRFGPAKNGQEIGVELGVRQADCACSSRHAIESCLGLADHIDGI